MAPVRLEQRRRLPRPASTGIPVPMATDWSDPEQVERELRRRERGEASGDEPQTDMRLLLGAVHAVLKAQKQTETNIASLTEDIATVRGLLARPEHARSAAQQPAPESGLATQLAQAEGRIAGHVDNLTALVRPVAATPKALEDLEATVRPLAEAVRAQTLATKANTSYLNRMTLDLKDMVRDADLGMRHRFAEEAKGVREALQEATAVVVKRRRRSIRFWLGLAGAVLFGLLVCVGLGVWLQSEYGPLPAYDPTGGWRGYIWEEFGSTLQDCIVKMRETGGPVDCRLSPPRS